MIVRIRFKSGPVKRLPAAAMPAAAAPARPAEAWARPRGPAAWLTAAAAGPAALALWRIAADLGFTDVFPVSSGPLSHWQAWFLLAAGLQGWAFAWKNRAARRTPAPAASMPPENQAGRRLERAG